MERPRIAAVAYLNALPLIWGLSRGARIGYSDLALLPPHECAQRLEEGFADIALIPSVEFARIAGLIPVPGLGISSRREVRSVLLVSKCPPASIKSLAVDLNSRTSVALSRLVLARRYGARPRLEVMPPSLGPMLERHDAALLIGDAALSAGPSDGEPGPDGRGLHVLDLAREWNLMTGLPFVFAFWACRPVVPLLDLQPILEESLKEGMSQIDRIAAEESARTCLPVELITTYLRQNIHYTLGPAESDSLRVFYRMCRENDLLRGPASREQATEPIQIAGRPEAPRP